MCWLMDRPAFHCGAIPTHGSFTPLVTLTLMVGYIRCSKLGKSMGEYDAPKTSTSLPYVDTSADVFSKQCENYEAKSARITRNHAYDAQNGTGTSATEVKSRDKDQRNLEGSGEVIPMEAFPEDEGVVIVDDFVSLETSPASPALLYPQQPVMRRQGYEERSKQTKAD